MNKREKLAEMIYKTNPIEIWEKETQSFKLIEFKDVDKFCDEDILKGILSISEAVLDWHEKQIEPIRKVWDRYEGKPNFPEERIEFITRMWSAIAEVLGKKKEVFREP